MNFRRLLFSLDRALLLLHRHLSRLLFDLQQLVGRLSGLDNSRHQWLQILHGRLPALHLDYDLLLFFTSHFELAGQLHSLVQFELQTLDCTLVLVAHKHLIGGHLFRRILAERLQVDQLDVLDFGSEILALIDLLLNELRFVEQVLQLQMEDVHFLFGLDDGR